MKFVKLTTRNDDIIYVNLERISEIYRTEDKDGEYTVLFGPEPEDYKIEVNETPEEIMQILV